MGKKSNRDFIKEDIKRATMDEQPDPQRDTLPLKGTIVLVDERNQAGIGEGVSSKTFSLVATITDNPSGLRKVYNKYDRGSNYETGEYIELKEKNADLDERKKVIWDMIRSGAHFCEVTVDKTADMLPKGFDPKKGMHLYRNTLDALMDEVMGNLKSEEVSVFFDDHTSLKGNAGVKSAKNAAKKYCKKIICSKQLASANEPLLQLNDFPTGAVGRMAEDNDNRSFKVMKKYTKSKKIGKRQR